MSGKLEYLEKYSVAPSPSRDYYGLRVFDDQVTLYLWRISHGPHKTPIVRTSGFTDFKQDQRLQDEILRIFGEYLLKHVQAVASGQNTLLTLPRCLIKRLIKYITVQDIVKLSSLSHISKEIFDDNLVWETLYKKYMPLTRNIYEKLRTGTYTWKQLFQLSQIQELSNEQKMFRTRGTAKQMKGNLKIENSTKTNLKLENFTKSTAKMENLMKVSNSSSKIASKIVPPEGQVTKKSAEMPRKKNAQNVISRKLSDNRLNESIIEKEKLISEKRTPVIRSLQATGQKNMKALKEQSIVTKVNSKQEVNKDSIGNKSAELKTNKISSKVKKIDAKSSNTSIKAAEEKLNNMKARSSATAKINGRDNKNNGNGIIEKPVSRFIQGDQSKPKSKSKTKKICQSKSTIFSTNTALLNDNSTIKDDTFELADLIEASLKNIRSPRSIFDYGFSCIEKPKSCGGDAKARDILRKMADHPRALKNGYAKAALDRLSEKSEPLTGKSMDSVNKNEISQRSVTPKSVKGSNAELRKSTELPKNQYKVTMPEEKTDHFERYGIYNKYPTPRIQDNIEQKKGTPRKEEILDKMSLLRSLGSKTLQGKNVGSTAAVEVNRYELGKTMNDVYKYL